MGETPKKPLESLRVDVPEGQQPERRSPLEGFFVNEQGDLSRRREEERVQTAARVEEVRASVDAIPTSATPVEPAKSEGYIEKHLPAYLRRDTVAAKLHRRIMRTYVEVQEALGLLTVEGREHIPEGPFIAIANHSRPSDDKRIIGILDRPLHIVTADFHFNMTPVSRWLMHQLGEIEIRPTLSNLTLEEQEAILPRLSNRLEEAYYRGLIEEGKQKKGGDLLRHRAFLRTTVSTLLRGETVLLFPEGPWVYEGHVLRRAYPGIEAIATEYRRISRKELPVLPIGLGDKEVKIGEVTTNETTDQLMRRVAALLPEEARGYYKEQV